MSDKSNYRWFASVHFSTNFDGFEFGAASSVALPVVNIVICDLRVVFYEDRMGLLQGNQAFVDELFDQKLYRIWI